MIAPLLVQSNPVAAGLASSHVHLLTSHVCADPEAAVVDSVYPSLQLLQSTVSVSHNVPADPVAKVGEPLGQVQVLAVHVSVLN